MDRRRFLGLSLAATSAWASHPPPVHAIQEPRWRPDGAGSVARIGVLTPDFDPVPESEMSAIAPDGVSIHGSRVVRNQTAAAFAEPPHVDTAAERLRDLAPRANVFAYTSSSYVLGADADGPVRTRLEARARGIPVILTCPSAVDALRLLGAKRVALIHPPWFSDEVNAKGMDYFDHQGFEVVQCTRIAPARSFTEVRPPEVYEWVRAAAGTSGLRRRQRPSRGRRHRCSGSGARQTGSHGKPGGVLGRTARVEPRCGDH